MSFELAAHQKINDMPFAALDVVEDFLLHRDDAEVGVEMLGEFREEEFDELDEERGEEFFEELVMFNLLFRRSSPERLTAFHT